jgi:hypothetical protein
LLVLPVVQQLLNGHKVLTVQVFAVVFGSLQVHGLEDRSECSSSDLFDELVPLSKGVQFIKPDCSGCLGHLGNLYLVLDLLGLLLLAILFSKLLKEEKIVIGLVCSIVLIRSF